MRESLYEFSEAKMAVCDGSSHAERHAFAHWQPRSREGLALFTRRSLLKLSLAGTAGLSLPRLMERRARAGESARPKKSVILLWMAGGPSHIDMWDPKPDAPKEIRGPFHTIETALPGVRLCEYLPKQAALMDKLTLIRSVDCRLSDHQPTQVVQTANREADPRKNREGHAYPAIGSIVAKHRGANVEGLPPYVALNLLDKTHIAWGGYLGQQYDPFVPRGDKVFELPSSLTEQSLDDRTALRSQLDRLSRRLDASGSMDALDQFERQAMELVTGPKAREAFDLSREPVAVREKFGDHAWAKNALLARRLVESGVTFVTLVLSNHNSSGTWDTHGDNIPPYGGIWNGLRPLLPVFDHVYTTLITDLAERGLLDDTLVLAMGEFGRTPLTGTQESTDGRNHWPVVMSALLAGGDFKHGQVIGSTERDGGHIKERPVTPGDLAATIYHHLEVPLDGQYTDFRGRPRNFIDEGAALPELG